MLRKTAQSLDRLVSSLPVLKAAVRDLENISDTAFKRLLEKAGRPKLAKKSDAVSPEYAKALIEAAVREIQKIERFADQDDVADEFPEMVDDEVADDEDASGTEDAAPEGDEPPSLTEEPGEDLPSLEEDGDLTTPGMEEEPEVEITIDGDGVQVVHAEDSKLYMILPDNSVLKMEEAGPKEAKLALAMLKKQAEAPKVKEPKKMPQLDADAEEAKAKAERIKTLEKQVKELQADKGKERTPAAVKKETKSFFNPLARKRITETNTRDSRKA